MLMAQSNVSFLVKFCTKLNKQYTDNIFEEMDCTHLIFGSVDL